MSTPRSRPNGSLEREVIACLAVAPEPMTVAQVRAELDGELAYTTVMTILTRLQAKGAVTRVPAGRAFAYCLAGDSADAEASLTAHQMHRLLQAGPDRAGVLSRFVDSLDAETESVLRALLAEESDQ